MRPVPKARTKVADCPSVRVKVADTPSPLTGRGTSASRVRDWPAARAWTAVAPELPSRRRNSGTERA